MYCVCKQFNYFFNSVPGLVTVLRQKVFISHNFSLRLLHSAKGLYILQNRVQKYTHQVSAYNNSKYGSVSNILMKYGFSGDDAKRMISSHPQLLDLDEKSIATNIIKWFSFKMSEKDLFRTLASCPALLFLNPEYVNDRTKELGTVFTNNDILKLLKTYPEVFLEDWNMIMEKMEYLLHYMGAEQKTIIKTVALQYSLDHMQKRHLFLLYTGKFKTPTEKKKQTNPPLGKIFGNTSAYVKLTGLSKEEYIAFCEVFPHMEFENLYGSESDTHDNGSDSENDESDED